MDPAGKGRTHCSCSSSPCHAGKCNLCIPSIYALYVYFYERCLRLLTRILLCVQLVELRGRHESHGWGGLPPCSKPGLGLGSSNYMSRPKEVTWGRPITGAGSKPMQWPHNYGHSQHQVTFYKNWHLKNKKQSSQTHRWFKA